MPLAGKGMLLTSMDIDPPDEAEFNRWYDREHLEERVAIQGFLEARRYVAHQGAPKYLCLYSTETFEVLDSAAYRTALANQTDWSKATMARFKNMIRAVARITISRGQGRGAVLGIVRLRPSTVGAEKLRAVASGCARSRHCSTASSRCICSRAIPRFPNRSRDTPSASEPGAGDWFVLIDGTDVNAIPAAIAARFGDGTAFRPAVISTGIYRLMWDLAKSDLPALKRVADRPHVALPQ